MACPKKTVFLVLLICLTAVGSVLCGEFDVRRTPRPGDGLDRNWAWAEREAAKIKPSSEIWVGYSIRRLMGAHVYISSSGNYIISGSFPAHRSWRGRSLQEIVSGESPVEKKLTEEDLKRYARSVLDRSSTRGPLVWKDLGILLRFRSNDLRSPLAIRLNTLDFPFNPQDAPLFWLGRTEDRDSIERLSKLYDKSADLRFKKRLISAIGSHNNADSAFPFLSDILESKTHEVLRARAASELGEQNAEEAVVLLAEAAKKDRSFSVRKHAVFGLEDSPVPSSVDALIDLGRSADHMKIRKYAISALAEKASDKAALEIKDIIETNPDVEIQKYAVYALEDFPEDEGVPILIRIAKTHPKAAVRKAAIQTLGDTGDPRALEALVDILKDIK
jgi:hypothetical protein